MPSTDSSLSINPDEVYDIAAVCRLTGLTAANLRMWEKRYQVADPIRSESGRRQYNRRDLQRLTLLKALADEGHRIRTTANLPIAELETRLEETVRKDSKRTNRAVPKDRAPHACRICVIGSHLSELVSSGVVLPANAATIAEFPELSEAESTEFPEAVDLILVECPALFEHDIARINRLIDQTRALRAIILYAYAQSQTIKHLQESGSRITIIRAPISAAELKVACATDIALTNRSASAAIKNAPRNREVTEEVPARRFNNRELAAISQVTSVVECECPHQLSALLTSLNGFESYSAQCENRNAADAEIHAYLHRMTASARAIIEDSLQVLLEYEGIAIEVGDESK